jgi:hypothetical protein
MATTSNSDAPVAAPPTDWPMLPVVEVPAVHDPDPIPETSDDEDPPPGRRLRLPGYMAPLTRPSEADQQPADDQPTDDYPTDNHPTEHTGPEALHGTEDPARPSDSTWWNRPTAPQPVVAPAPDGRRAGRRHGLLIGVGLVAAVILASVSLASLLRPAHNSGPQRPGGTGAAGSGSSATGSPFTTSAPIGGIRSAEFQLVAGVTAIVVRTADLGADLYRVATPAASGFVPRVEQDGAQVRLRLTTLYDTDHIDEVTVELNARVRWRVNLLAGSESATVDLRTADLAGVDFAGGVARIELWLPEPRGNVGVRMSGGVRDFTIHAPGSTPVQVRLARGAGTVTVDRAVRSGVAVGTRVTPTGWDKAPDRYDIDAVAGLGTLIVDRY